MRKKNGFFERLFQKKVSFGTSGTSEDSNKWLPADLLESCILPYLSLKKDQIEGNLELLAYQVLTCENLEQFDEDHLHKIKETEIFKNACKVMNTPICPELVVNRILYVKSVSTQGKATKLYTADRCSGGSWLLNQPGSKLRQIPATTLLPSSFYTKAEISELQKQKIINGLGFYRYNSLVNDGYIQFDIAWPSVKKYLDDNTKKFVIHTSVFNENVFLTAYDDQAELTRHILYYLSSEDCFVMYSHGRVVWLFEYIQELSTRCQTLSNFKN